MGSCLKIMTYDIHTRIPRRLVAHVVVLRFPSCVGIGISKFNKFEGIPFACRAS